MIRSLYIRDFVLIDEVNLDFEDGFSAFTGETGAGKSILIDAISLLLGGKASSTLVAKGKEKAIVEATFDLSEDPNALSVLNGAGFETEGDVTFTRELSSNGKSVSRIDHRVVPLTLLRDVLEDAVDIHGQRDNAYLLNTANHLKLLDAFLGNESLCEEVKNAFSVYDGLLKEKKKALEETYNENDLEYFRFEVKEIEEADLKDGEEEELQEKERQFRLVKDSYEKLNSVFSLYDESISDNLYELNRTVQSLGSDEKFSSVQETVNDAYYGIADAMDSLKGMLDDMDLSEEEINAMEERLFLIQKLKRKYGRNIAEILEKKDSIQAQIDLFENRQAWMEEMDRKIDAAYQEYESLAEKLGDSRRNGSSRLDSAVESHLKDLMLENAGFRTELKECGPSSHGNETAEFMVSMNKGQDFRPLSKTASGGELSRLMLGLKVIFTKLQGIGTVIFDEIDTGVSGPVATAIGKKMDSLSEDCQVFAVTHLAQVAACAGRQYLVSKASDETAAHTAVKLLDDAERAEQIALIASGEVTDVSLSMARELLERNGR